MRTECQAQRGLLEQKLLNVDCHVTSLEGDLDEIKSTIAEMRQEIHDEYKSLNDSFSIFTVEFRRQIIYILFISCVILISVIIGRSVDFGWIAS